MWRPSPAALIERPGQWRRAMRVCLFGPLRVCFEGGSLGHDDFEGLKPKQIFEILALDRGHPVPKDRLAELLWPQDPPRSAFAAIESYVSVVRRILGPMRHVLVTEPEAYRVDADRVVLDLDLFDQRLRRAARAPDERRRRRRLEAGLALVAGEVLEDEPYAAWAEAAREQFRPRVLRARLEAAEAALALADHAGAADHARNLLASDPWDEQAYRVLIRAEAAAGRRHEALRAYERCRSALGELGLEPLEETRLLVRSICGRCA